MKRKNTPIGWLLLFAMLVASPCLRASGDDRSISGKVTDSDGNALIGASVVEQNNTRNGTVTDANGAFQLRVGDQATALVVSYTGYKTTVFPIAGLSTVEIVLMESDEALDEVIVVAYGRQKKSDLTGAVASANVQDLKKIPTADAATALQGQVAGVSVASATGAPGAAPVVRIRGLGTIGNNAPLYVIDGIPGDISYIDPADIESINVLKDASAATIYGARASNGVVIVSTRRGKSGAPTVTFNSFWGNNQLTNNIDLVNKAQYNQISRQAQENAGEAPLPFTVDDTRFFDTRWADEYFKDGFEQKYDLGISGGSEKMNYLFSGGYYNNTGTMINTGFERYNTRLNLDIKLLGDRLTVSPGIGYARKNRKNVYEPLEGGNAGFSPILSVFTALPHKAAYDPLSPNGFATAPAELGTAGAGNPVGERSLENDRNQDDYVQLNLNTDLKLFGGLSYQFQIGANTEDFYNKYFLPTYDFGATAFNEDPRLFETRGRLNEWVMNNLLSFDRSFGKARVSALAGVSREKHEFRSTSGGNRKLASNALDALSGGIGDASSSGTKVVNTIQSWFGRVNLNYDRRYLLEASLRRDGSSRFAADNKYGNFYSFSLGWAIHNEAFFGKHVISELKPRFSYGILGNQNIGDHLFLSRISSSGPELNYPFGSATRQEIFVGAISTQLPTPDIKWEETATMNIGLDLGLFDDRWLLTFDVFNSKTSDMLVSIPVPTSSGITAFPLTNGGEMENRGWEISSLWRNRTGAWSYDFGLNFGATKNKVTKLGYADESFTDGYIDYVNFPTTRTEVGGEIGRFYLFDADGIFQNQAEIDAHQVQPNAQPGDLRFRDTNGDGVLNDDDRVYFGSGLPKLEYGITLNVAWKNIDLSLLLNGTSGNKMYNGMKMWLYRAGTSPDRLDSWTPQNTGTDVFRLITTDPNSNIRPSDYFLEDASYLRLRNFQIGYSLPRALLSDWKISRLRVYAGGYNLLTFTKYTGFDPGLVSYGLFTRGVDRGYYPLSRSLVFGVNLTF
jgi:TonB-linked SusC/RagA family outer membrane protein